ncbi:PREDICTED: protein MIS12 homolog isoform X2 [Camelina sativa]|uniref:Protein MIS12 homolog isoform X2 n=1 Tax=Camelina sativa TaxID=90675 RepID=A0ABM0V3X3_CAMSA|nr:PREDICTED: protein MIS12 homolog isoform X2 [Camelina sativa]
MEGSKSEAVFESMNLNPQLFINDAINTIEDYVDAAFEFYGQEASKILKIDGSDPAKSQDLSNSIERVRNLIQSVMDKRMEMWEVYCVKYCFAVPDGFVLPKTEESSSSSVYSDQEMKDQDLDAQLDSLRDKLNLVGKRSEELDSELQALERASASREQSVRLVNEALELYDESSVGEMFKEMAKVASDLRARVDTLKTRRMKASESGKVETLNNHGKEFSAMTSDGKLEDLEKFQAELRKM